MTSTNITSIDDDKEEVVILSTSKQSSEPEDDFRLPFGELKKLAGISSSYISGFRRRYKKGYRGINGAHSKQIEIEEIQGYGFLDCVQPPENLESLAKLYDISPAHHAAVNAKVESVFGLGYEFKESHKTKAAKPRTENGLKRKEAWLEQTKAMLEDWLESLNDQEAFEEIMRKVGIDYETMGNGYIEIGRDKKGQIGYIGHVPAAKIRVRRLRDGFVQIFGGDIQYFKNFGDKSPNEVTTDQNPNELIHLKKYTPSNSYYGLPDVISSEKALAGNEFAGRYNLDFFENKAMPRTAIISKGNALSSASVTKLLEFLESGLKGQHHRSIFIPVSKDKDAELKFEQLEVDQRDFSFGGYRDSNNAEIFMSHRVPMTRAGVFGGTTVAAARDADKVFKESYSRPEQTIFEKKVAKIFREKTDAFVFKLNELTLTDEDTQSKINERNIRNGLNVPDEIRARSGEGPRPDGKGMEVFEIKPQQAADQKATTNKTRQRDAERSSNSTDSANNAEGRGTKGEGRVTS